MGLLRSVPWMKSLSFALMIPNRLRPAAQSFRVWVPCPDEEKIALLAERLTIAGCLAIGAEVGEEAAHPLVRKIVANFRHDTENVARTVFLHFIAIVIFPTESSRSQPPSPTGLPTAG